MGMGTLWEIYALIFYFFPLFFISPPRICIKLLHVSFIHLYFSARGSASWWRCHLQNNKVPLAARRAPPLFPHEVIAFKLEILLTITSWVPMSTALRLIPGLLPCRLLCFSFLPCVRLSSVGSGFLIGSHQRIFAVSCWAPCVVQGRKLQIPSHN